MISYRSELDGIRAIAIISVVLFHGWGSVFSGGYVGVDIFFVISGYLITSIIFREMKEGSFTYLNFYTRRARRILPALLALIVATTAAAFLLFFPDDLIEYGKIVIYTLLFGSNFRLAAEPGYFHHSMQENPLLHMWSLSVEEQFYLLWPMLLALMIRFLPEKRHRQAVLGLCLLSLLAAEVVVHLWPRSAFFHLPTRGWELLVGVLLAMGFIPRIASRLLSETLAAIGLTLMIAPLFLYDKDTPFPGLAALVPVLGCALVIHSTANERTRVGALLSWKPIVFVGLISYSLYLWHWPIFAFATYELLRPLTTIEALLCTLAAVLGAIVSWRFVEQPFRRRRKPPLTGPLQQKRFFIPSIGWAGQFALALTAVLIACGSFFQESKGAAWRFTVEARNFLDNVGTGLAHCQSKNTGRPEFAECEFGDQPGDLVLWGDSHAQHYMPLVAKIYGGGTAYFTPGCPPLHNAYLIEKSGKPFFVNCQSNNHYVLERILALKPKIVVMASRWTQIEDLPYGHESRPVLYLVDETAETTREASRKTFAHAIDQTVSMLSSAGIKVVLMGQVPEMLFPPSRCVSPFLVPGRDCSVTLQEAERRQNYVNATLKSVARNNRGVFFFSPFSELCDKAYCYAAKDHRPYYLNNDHLNQSGALLLVDAFRKALPEPFLLAGATQGPSKFVSWPNVSKWTLARNSDRTPPNP